MGGLSSVASTLKGAIAGIGMSILVHEVVQAAQAAVQASTQFAGIQNAFKAIQGSSFGAADSLAFVRAEANRIGVDFTKAAEGFKGLTAAAQGTALEGKGIQDVFSGVTEATRVMGLGTEKTERVLGAMVKILSTGTVQSDEFRGMLAEALPNATQVASRALGVTTTALAKLMEQGKLISTEFVPKFVHQMAVEVVGGLAAASQSFQAETARMGNAGQQFLVVMGDFATKSPEVIGAVKAIAGVIEGLSQQLATGEGRFASYITILGRLVKTAADIAAGITPNTVDRLGQQLSQNQQEMQALTASLERQKTIAADPVLRNLYNLTTGAVSLGNAPSIDEIVANANRELDRMKQKEGDLRTARIEAMRLQAGLGGFETPIVGAELLGGGTQGAGGESLLQRTRKEVDALSGVNVNKITEIEAKLKTLRASLLLETDAGRIAGTNEAIRLLEKQLEGIGGKAAKTAIDGLENVQKRMQQLRDFLASPPPGTPQGMLEQAKKQLEDLTVKQLPEALQSFARLQNDIAGLQGVLASGAGAPTERLALQRQLDELNTRQLPEALQQAAKFQNTVDDLGRTLDVAHTGGWKLTEDQIGQVAVALDNAKLAADQFNLSVEKQVGTKRFQEMRDKEEDATRRAQDLVNAQKQQAQFQADLAQQAATTFAQREDAAKQLAATMLHLNGDESAAREAAHQGALRQQADSKRVQQTQIDQAFTLREITATTEAERRQNAADKIAALKAAGVDEVKIQELVFSEERRQLEEQTRAWQQFTETVQGLLADNIFNFLTGKVNDTESLLKKLRDSFVRIFSEDLSKNITGFVTNLLKGIQTTGTGSVSTGTGTGSPGTGSTGTGGVTTSLVSSVSGSIGSYLDRYFGGGQTTRITPIDASSGQPISDTPGPSGAGRNEFDWSAQQTGASTGANTSFTTGGGGYGSGMSGLGNAGSAAGQGILLGQFLYDAQRSTGTDFGSGTLAGARAGTIGGGWAGFQTAGIPGAIIGAVIGGVLGGLEASKAKEPPALNTETLTLPTFLQTPLGIRYTSLNNPLTPTFGVSESIDKKSAEYGEITKAFERTGQQIFGTLNSQVGQLPQKFQTGVVDKLNLMVADFGTRIDGVRFAGKNMGDTMAGIKDYLEHDVPREFESVFGTFIETLQKIAPVAQAFESAITTLKTNEARLMAVIHGAQSGLEESLFTPAQLFVKRQDTLQDLVTQFDTGTAATKLRLAPNIAALTGEVFGLAKNEEVLGKDLPALKALQVELQGILKEVEGSSADAFAAQKNIAERQLTVLQTSLNTQTGIEEGINKSLDVLGKMQNFFTRAFAGSFQEGGVVPHTGLALVHRGETVVPRGDTMHTNYNVTVHVQGGGNVDASAIAEKIGAELDRRERLGQRNRMARR